MAKALAQLVLEYAPPWLAWGRTRDDLLEHIIDPHHPSIPDTREAESGPSSAPVGHFTPALWKLWLPWCVAIWTGARFLDQALELPEVPYGQWFLLAMSAGLSLATLSLTTFHSLQQELLKRLPSMAARRGAVLGASGQTRIHLRSVASLVGAGVLVTSGTAGLIVSYHYGRAQFDVELPQTTLGELEKAGLVTWEVDRANHELRLSLRPQMLEPAVSMHCLTPAHRDQATAHWRVRFSYTDTGVRFGQTKESQWKAEGEIHDEAAKRLHLPPVFSSFQTLNDCQLLSPPAALRLATGEISDGEQEVAQLNVSIGLSVDAPCLQPNSSTNILHVRGSNHWFAARKE